MRCCHRKMRCCHGENALLKRRLGDQEKNEERRSQRLRITWPQGDVRPQDGVRPQDDVNRTAYGVLERIPVFQLENGARVSFASLHSDVKDALLRWSQSNELKDWHKQGLLRSTSCVRTPRRQARKVPRGSHNVACDLCVSKKAFCIRRWSGSFCLYPLHSVDGGQHRFESVSFWILCQERLGKQLYSTGEKLTAY